MVCPSNIKVNRLKSNAVAEVKTFIFALTDLYNIRNGHRLAVISGRCFVRIAEGKNAFKAFAVYRTAVDLTVYGRIHAAVCLCVIIIHKSKLVTVLVVIDLKYAYFHLRSFYLRKPFNCPFWNLIIVRNSAEILTVKMRLLAVRKKLPEHLSARFFGIAAKTSRCVEILIYGALELLIKNFRLKDQQLSFVVLRLIGVNALLFSHKSELAIFLSDLIDKAVKHGRMRINAIFPHFFLGNIWGDNRPCPLLIFM